MPAQQIFLWVFFLMAGLPPVAPEVPAAEPDCKPHVLKADQLKETLWRSRALTAFKGWSLSDLVLDPCVIAEAVAARLILTPPADWSYRRVTFRVQARLRLDGVSGAPLEDPPNLRLLANRVRRVVLRAEAHPDVDRFLERYQVVGAEIEEGSGPDQLQVTFLAQPVPGSSGERAPRLVFNEAAADGVVAYQLPRMDGLPVRRELLRFVEALSLHHPRCWPSWVVAQWHDGKSLEGVPEKAPEKTSGPPARWELRADLEGKDCPKLFGAEVTPEGAVIHITLPEPGSAPR